MPLPEQIPVRYAEDDAGYVTMRPVVKQTFRLNELVDMVVGVAGKDPARIQQILRSGTVLYNGYHYWWAPLTAEQPEIEVLLAGFPDDDPSRLFNPANVTAALLESGGGTQRNLVEITASEAGGKKLFAHTSPWDVLMQFAAGHTLRYEKYSYGRRADLFRLTLHFDQAQQLLSAMLEAAPRGLRHRWSTLRPPAALTFVLPRK
ncbi:MAG TPA: hypothetical protein VJX72_07340 [Candidatus Acidoferrum sp.]|jgi:hypothetical protein|nr:hypothetical protein [Candidatus Acidoferrum sp.]